jgi:hypothetical protein
MRSSPSTIQRRHAFQPMVTDEPSSIIMTPQSGKSNFYDVGSADTRTIATMCISPSNLENSTPVNIPTTSNVDTSRTTVEAVTTLDTSRTQDMTARNNIVNTVPVMLDLAPGVKIHLRGAEETQRAINTGFYIQCECLVCSVAGASSSSSSSSTSSPNTPKNEMYCILDCDYFICPTCRSVHPNPISTNSNDPSTPSRNQHGPRYPGGLGLGFYLEK